MMIRRKNLFDVAVALGLLLGSTSAAVSGPIAGGRQPVPNESEVANSRQLVRSAYEEEYRTARQSGEPASLMAALLGSVETSRDPVRQYSLLLEAEELAMQHEDVGSALGVVDKRARLFDVDGLRQRAEMLERLAGPKVSGDAVLLEQAMQTAKQAVAAERFDIATESASLAISIAKSIDKAQKGEARKQHRRPANNEKLPAPTGPALVKEAQDLHSRISEHKKAFAAYREASVALEKDPDDTEANTATGTYLCLVARKWDDGLPYLGKSNLQPLSVLAKEENDLRSAVTSDAPKMFALAGKWWAAADAQENVSGGNEAIRLHSATLYSDVLPQLKDPLERRVAETRIKPYGFTLATKSREFFLSDLAEQDPVVGYGVFGKNGELGYEGLKIVVGGEPSPKGISLHPFSGGTSRVTYRVPEGCTHFEGRAAIADGRLPQQTAVIFRVLNDQEQVLWKSRPLKGKGAGEECSIALNGTKTVTLTVECPGSWDYAYAVWVEPRFVSRGMDAGVTPGNAEPVAAAVKGRDVFLSDLAEQDPVVGYGVFGKNGQLGYEGLKIVVGGEPSPKGISVHPFSNGMSRVTYEVPEGCTHFEGRAAIADGRLPQQTAVIFRVLNEQEDVLWKSRPLKGKGAGEECSIALNGAKSVTLTVECPGSFNYAYAVWVEPRFATIHNGRNPRK
ncbi:MAG: NPCBM/NEW2 domain-containing protein [Pirellulales bacterium]